MADDTLDILRRLGAGEDTAAEKLLPRVYDELKQIAAKQMQRERPDHTLQATILVHEAFMKLVHQERANWQDRSHFMAVASTQMRRVLVDYARRAQAKKRGANANRISLDVCGPAESNDAIDLIQLDDALTRLADLNERHARVVELRYFGGMSVKETAHALSVSEATIKNDWRAARAWLLLELEK